MARIIQGGQFVTDVILSAGFVYLTAINRISKLILLCQITTRSDRMMVARRFNAGIDCDSSFRHVRDD